MGGGGDTQVRLPGPTAGEQALQDEQAKLARLQTGLLQRQQALQFPRETLASIEAGSPEFASMDTPEFRDELNRVITQRASERQLYDEVTQRLQARLEGREFVTPEQRATIGETFGAARATGEEDIRRFAEELAGQRGLRLADSPIGGEAIRAQERLSQGLRSSEASSLLEFGDRERIFNEQIRQFQTGLQQQAIANRLALIGAQPANLMSGLQLAQQQRMAQPSTSFSPSLIQNLTAAGQLGLGAGGLAYGLGSLGLFGGGAAAGGLGAAGIFGGAGAAGAAGTWGGSMAMGSDRRLKQNSRRIERAIEKIRRLTGYAFTWRDAERPGHGVMAQEMATVMPEAVMADARGMLMVDYAAVIALLVEAVKELAGGADGGRDH